MGGVFTWTCLACLFFIIRHTTLVANVATAEDTTTLTHTDSNTAWMGIRQASYFLIGE